MVVEVCVVVGTHGMAKCEGEVRQLVTFWVRTLRLGAQEDLCGGLKITCAVGLLLCAVWCERPWAHAVPGCSR